MIAFQAGAKVWIAGGTTDMRWRINSPNPFAKFGQRLPLNRQVERFAKEGVEISLSTLADQVGACAAVLASIRAHLLTARRLHAPRGVQAACQATGNACSHA